MMRLEHSRGHSVNKVTRAASAIGRVSARQIAPACCLLGLLFVLVSEAYAGRGVAAGNEPGLWTDRRYSVIVANVKEVVALEAVGPTHRAVVEPLLTVAGRLDPTE